MLYGVCGTAQSDTTQFYKCDLLEVAAATKAVLPVAKELDIEVAESGECARTRTTHGDGDDGLQEVEGGRRSRMWALCTGRLARREESGEDRAQR